MKWLCLSFNGGKTYEHRGDVKVWEIAGWAWGNKKLTEAAVPLSPFLLPTFREN